MAYHRTELADEMARQILHPRALDPQFEAGVFLSGPRRIGKTTFIRQDLMPALQGQDAIVMYADLWSQVQANPADLVTGAIEQTLADLQKPASDLFGRISRQLKRVSEIDVGGGGFKFGFKLDQLGKKTGPTLAAVFTEVVEKTRANVVLIIDEIQHAMGSAAGNELLLALKAARDAVNLEPGMPGKLFIIGTGSHRAQVQEMVMRGNQAFQGAWSQPFPLLGEDYVTYVLDQTREQLGDRLPTLPVAINAFQQLGSRPEEMLKALIALRDSPSDLAPDAQLPIIVQALRHSAADVEISRAESLGDLATAVFHRICLSDGPTGGFYSAETNQALTSEIGMPVSQSAVQNALLSLTDANLVMSTGKGKYDATDPFVKIAWRESRGLALALGLNEDPPGESDE
ncbi:ATP-binding protein [Caballeronia sp. LZ065]|uniref:ATP-binding protein n=1 Tax=Caballeronia sp. LZ065 TaxID=3038571 RepID=UPI00286723C6|nr:ATP-binding protein [Caballeronia sp. LZ065]MDR5780632.1 ATP-binding protein [Caballeronia sp. LZ065]